MLTEAAGRSADSARVRVRRFELKSLSFLAIKAGYSGRFDAEETN
jgi:hypothetical protein